MQKHEVFGYVLDRCCDPPVTVLEIGRMRDARPQYKTGDGWSTLEFARSSKVGVLYSIDNDPKTLAVCSEFPELCTGKVVFSGGVETLSLPQIDLLYLDAENDAEATVWHYETAREYLSADAVILIDDAHSPEGKKGDLIIPLLEKEGYKIETIWPMALARRVA